MSEIKLDAELRTEFGKGAARRTRRANRIPAVLYGHGTDPIHISLASHETMLALRNSNALLSVVVDGKANLSLPKQVQRDPIKGNIEHLDLLIVRRGEKVSVDIPIHVVGEPHPDAMIVTENNVISLKVSASNIPELLEVSITGIEPGTQILAKDLDLPEGAELDVDGEHMIINITAAPTAEQVEAELAEAEAEAGIEATVDEDAESSEDDETEGDESSEDAPAEQE